MREHGSPFNWYTTDEYITDALVSLHWLRVPECIQIQDRHSDLQGFPQHCAAVPLGPFDRVADLPGRRTHQSYGGANIQPVHGW